MPEPEADRSPTAAAGWLLVADHTVLDIDPMIEAVGQVYRYPVADAERAQAMEPGQPCFLLRTDRSKVIGLWAVGEIVGESAPLEDDPDGRWAAEVELLPLEKAIARTKLAGHKALAAGPVADATFADTPIALGRGEVRAFETFDFFLVDPRPDQLDALDDLLAAEDPTDGAPSA
ncbi:MAG: hypothetical protein JWO77_3481 [Ilumatobacteraceae bacterium]|nr:hypothetical protein [Ilumatobacteraceae bacterium]